MPRMLIECCEETRPYHTVKLSEEQLLFLKVEMEFLAGQPIPERRKTLARSVVQRCIDHLKHWASLKGIEDRAEVTRDRVRKKYHNRKAS